MSLEKARSKTKKAKITVLFFFSFFSLLGNMDSSDAENGPTGAPQPPAEVRYLFFIIKDRYTVKTQGYKLIVDNDVNLAINMVEKKYNAHLPSPYCRFDLPAAGFTDAEGRKVSNICRLKPNETPEDASADTQAAQGAAVSPPHAQDPSTFGAPGFANIYFGNFNFTDATSGALNAAVGFDVAKSKICELTNEVLRSFSGGPVTVNCNNATGGSFAGSNNVVHGGPTSAESPGTETWTLTRDQVEAHLSGESPLEGDLLQALQTHVKHLPGVANVRGWHEIKTQLDTHQSDMQREMRELKSEMKRESHEMTRLVLAAIASRDVAVDTPCPTPSPQASMEDCD
jgi:hypothetical protein